MYDLRCDPVVLATVCPTIDGYGFSFNTTDNTFHSLYDVLLSIY